MQVGITLTDVPADRPGSEQFRDILRLVEAAQRNGVTYIALGQHFLYGDLRWLQPVPLLARLAAEVTPETRLLTNILISPLYHPVLLAEDLATLDIVTEGRFVLGLGLGYRPDEFVALGINQKTRVGRLEEGLEIMKKLWTEDEVTFQGRYWQLDAVTPHIRPTQQPHMPVWIGGVALAGAVRAGRIADGYITNPEATEADIRERLLAVQEGFAERGRPMNRQPLRRNVMLGKDQDEAVRRYMAASQARYQAYAARGLDVYDEDALDRDFAETVKSHALLGTPDQVIEQVRGLAAQFPIDPLLLRPQWPTTSTDDAIALLDDLGKEVIPAIREMESVTSVQTSTVG